MLAAHTAHVAGRRGELVVVIIRGCLCVVDDVTPRARRTTADDADVSERPRAHKDLATWETCANMTPNRNFSAT
jgi:hypothetical protein